MDNPVWLHWAHKTQDEEKHTTKRKLNNNTDPPKNRRRTNVFTRGKQFLPLIWHLPYNCLYGFPEMNFSSHITSHALSSMQYCSDKSILTKQIDYSM